MKIHHAILISMIMMFSTAVAAQEPMKVTSINANDVAWKELAPGISISPLWQDKNGNDTGLFLKLAPGYVGIKHGHSNAYNGVTVQGTWEHVDDDGTKHILPAGSYTHQPAKEFHSDNCTSDEACILFIHLAGKYDFFLPK